MRNRISHKLADAIKRERRYGNRELHEYRKAEALELFRRIVGPHAVLSEHPHVGESGRGYWVELNTGEILRAREPSLPGYTEYGPNKK